jgi:superfamily II DNA or RNA helicase
VAGRKPSEKAPLLIRRQDGEPATGVGPGVGLEFVQSCFPSARQSIRVATAYFSLRGYKLGRQFVGEDVKLSILVGREEGQHAQAAVLAEIEAELTQCEVDLHGTVADLVSRLKGGTFVIKDARAIPNPFHCKFYVCDEGAVWHGSANYTHKGLRENAEQASVTRDRENVSLFITWFDTVLPRAIDLVRPLIERLEAWLQLARPFDVYLMMLRYLVNLPDRPYRRGAHAPAFYQKSVIARALRQLAEFRGVLIVAATGLGKTVIAADIAARLSDQQKLDELILIAPNGVHDTWAAELRPRGIPYVAFPSEILFRKTSRKSHHMANRIDRQLAEAHDNTLIIVDEAHYYRNQLRPRSGRNWISRVYQRLSTATNAGASIVLLTATPYATSIQNLRSVLRALPPMAQLPGEDKRHWAVETAEEFARLPVVTLLGLQDVLREARKHGKVDSSDRPFVEFPDGPRYLPFRLKLRPIRYELPLQQELVAAFRSRCFSAPRIKHYVYDDDRGEFEGITDSVENATIDSWLSSPRALRECLELNLATPGKTDSEAQDDQLRLEFADLAGTVHANHAHEPVGSEKHRFRTVMNESLAHREHRVRPLLAAIDRMQSQDDLKLSHLIALVQRHAIDGHEKILVFVRRYRTALYLQDELRSAFRALVIDSTVYDQDGIARLLKPSRRAALRQRFAPMAQECASDEPEIDVLINTDADSVGVNLQDAPIVVNYDPPASADTLFQRAGRVLRLTADPTREITLYTFLPDFVIGPIPIEQPLTKVKEAFARLDRRHQKARTILGAPVFAALDLDVTLETTIDVAHAAEVTETQDSESTTFLQHVTIFEHHRSAAEKLSPPLHTVRSYDGEFRRVCVLLEAPSGIEMISYNEHSDSIERRTLIEFLNIVTCSPFQERLLMAAADVEAATNAAIRTWCATTNVDLADVRKLCAMYLIPLRDSEGSARTLFDA